jgi:membrane-associated protein
MLAVIKQIVHWFGPTFEAAGYWIVFGAVVAERSIFLGLFVPGDVILALGGVYAARHRLTLGWVIALGTIAAILGESIGFWLGRRYGESLIKKIPLVRRLEPRLDSAREYFRESGGWTVAVGRYATAAGAFVPFVAGTTRMPYRKFLMFDVPAIAVWAAGITLLGYFLGNELERIDRILARFGYAMLLALVLLILIVIMRRRRSGRAA